MIICIAGPSGIGKTKLSIELAKKYNAIVVNADATQVYQELDIGSAKVTDSEKENIKHYLIDIKNPNEDYSVCDFQNDARKILEENKNRNVIVVGGTGLYLKALFYDYKFSERSNNNYDELSNEQLYKMALAKDKNMNIHQNNRVRLINFLNNNNVSNNANKELYDVIYIGLTMPREEIYQRTDKRVDQMIYYGLEDEVRSLYKKYPNSRILRSAIGYKEMIKYINNEISLDEAINLIKKNTRHYVKRQYTWFKNQMTLNWFDVNIKDFEKTVYLIMEFIDSLNSK